MAKRRSSKRRIIKGGQPGDGIVETPPVAVVDVATAPEVSISGGGLVEIAVPAALIYSSIVLKKKFPSRHQYTSNKSRQILHWRKKHRKSRKSQRK